LVQRLDAVLARNVPIDFGIPNLVIHPIQDAPDFVAMDMQRMAEAIVLRTIHNFPRVARGNRRDEIRIDDAALHHVDGGMVKVILKTLLAEKVTVSVETSRAENMLSSQSLVLQIMQRVTDAGMGHPEGLIDLVQQHRRQAGLPIM